MMDDKYMSDKANFEKLRVYQQTLNLVDMIYKITKEFPKEEVYGLVAQLRRAIVSIALNIAEGQGRMSNAENKNFLLIARASIYEAMAILEIAFRQNYVSQEQRELVRKNLFSILRQLNSLIKYLRSK